MSRTMINVSAVLDASNQIDSAKSSASSARSKFRQTAGSVDRKIQDRSNIRNRLSTVQNQLENIDTQIGRIRSMVQTGANMYHSADSRVDAMKSCIKTDIAVHAASQTTGNWGAFFKKLEDVGNRLDVLSKVADGVGEYAKCDQTTLVSSILGYVGTVLNIATEKRVSGLDATSSILKLFQSSVSVEKGIFDYYEKTLHPYEAVKLDAKFGKTMSRLKIASGVADIGKSAIDIYKKFTDPESTAYDKAAEVVKIGDPVLKVGSEIYITSKLSTKTLQFVSTTTKSGKVVNQILDQPTLKYTTSQATAAKAKNIGAGVTIGCAVISGASAGIKQYGEVTADGTFDMGDAGSVGLNFAVSGLDSMASSVTFGLVDVDAEKVADDLEKDANKFVSGDSWAAKYIRDQDNNVVCRFGVSIGAGVYVLGENAVEGVVNSAKAVSSWLAQGWYQIPNIPINPYVGGGGFR